MSGKVWQPDEWKKFAKQAQMGRTYYVVYNIDTARCPWEDSQLYSEYTFTGYAPLTGSKQTKGGTTAGELCRNWGPVYEQPPQGMRAHSTPGPQVAGPLGSNDYEGVLDADELRGLEKRAGQGSNPRTRRPLGGWRI
ncbi:hypothetical protein OK074_2674 [Actinobacteria bacterium OK074]|nr:hypothetical protein OK074_2674 [Actinobacteria bacterium OK074]